MNLSKLLFGFLIFADLSVAYSSNIPSQNKKVPVSAKAVDITGYILGAGDTLEISSISAPDINTTVTIGPDGTVYLPSLRTLYAEGLTVDEFRYFLNQQYQVLLKSPDIFVRPVGYRDVSIYIRGEILRPGYYSLSSMNIPAQNSSDISSRQYSSFVLSRKDNNSTANLLKSSQNRTSELLSNPSYTPVRWPTLFDVIKAAQGITPFSDLTKVIVTRKRPLSSGGGKMQATINFMEVLKSGRQDLNIRVFDGDVIEVPKSTNELPELLRLASSSSISPRFIEVFISGRVRESGPQQLPQGSTLNQALASAGGPKLLRGDISFFRINPDGSTDNRRISLNNSLSAGDYSNPVLMQGDVIRVNDSIFSATVGVLNEVTGPAVGIYSVYSLFKP